MSAAPAQTDKTALSADEAAVRQVIDSYAEAMRAADIERIVGLYTDDAAVMAPDMPAAVGTSQLREVYQGALSAVAMDFSFTFDQVGVRGETAVARTHTEGHNTVRATGAEVLGRYRELFVLVRHESGWRISEYMFQPQPSEAK